MGSALANSPHIRKTLKGAAIKDLGDREVRAVVSTTDVDAENDRILNWDLTEFRRRRSVLANHDWNQFPVATAKQTWFDGRRLHSVATFPEPGFYPPSDLAYGAIKAGLPIHTSAGFQPLEWERNELGGFDIAEARLLEWSFVSVPANSLATVEVAKRYGLPLREAREELFRRCGDGACRSQPRDPVAVFEGLSDQERRRLVTSAIRPLFLDAFARSHAARTGRLP